MKRSEALDKIKKYFFSETNAFANVEADIMLKFFENELGMLPPETKKEEPGLLRNEWSEE